MTLFQFVSLSFIGHSQEGRKYFQDQFDHTTIFSYLIQCISLVCMFNQNVP